MPAIFKVKFNTFWDKDKVTEITATPDEIMTVSAKDAEEAIAKVRKSEVGQKVPSQDDDGNNIPGKFTVKTKIQIVGVDYVSSLDLD